MKHTPLSKRRPPSSDGKLYDLVYQKEQEADHEFLHFLRALLDQNCGGVRLLDAACGTGYPALLLGSKFEITLADRSSEMLDRAQDKARENPGGLRTFVKADWEALPALVGGDFDAVICTGNSFPMCLEANARMNALRSMRDVLKPGGILYLDFDDFEDRMLQKQFPVTRAIVAEPRLRLPRTLITVYELYDRSRLVRTKNFYALDRPSPTLYATVQTTYAHLHRAELTAHLSAAGFDRPIFALRPGAWSMPCLITRGTRR